MTQTNIVQAVIIPVNIFVSMGSFHPEFVGYYGFIHFFKVLKIEVGLKGQCQDSKA